MTEEEIITSEPEDYIPESEPTPEPDPAPVPEPESAPEPEPVPDPVPGPEAPAAPVEVITVEDLLDRITGETGEDGETEEPPQEAEGDAAAEAPAESGEVLPTEGTLEGPIEVIGMDTALKRLETIQGVVDHPMMETPFEDYTVTEGLLLLFLLSVFLAACVKLLKGGFAWLR